MSHVKITHEGVEYTITTDPVSGTRLVTPDPPLSLRQLLLLDHDQPCASQPRHQSTSPDDNRTMDQMAKMTEILALLTTHLTSHQTTTAPSPAYTNASQFTFQARNNDSFKARQRPTTFTNEKDSISALSWIRSVEAYLTANHAIDDWESGRNLIINCIGGKTRAWMEDTVHRCHTWNEFKLEFEQQYVRNLNNFINFNDVHACTLSGNDSMTDYIAKKKAMLRQLDPNMTHQSMKAFIMEGLDDFYKPRVNALVGNQECTMTEFEKRCHELYIEKLSFESTKNARRCANCRGKHATDDCLRPSTANSRKETNKRTSDQFIRKSHFNDKKVDDQKQREGERKDTQGDRNPKGQTRYKYVRVVAEDLSSESESAKDTASEDEIETVDTNSMEPIDIADLYAVTNKVPPVLNNVALKQSKNNYRINNVMVDNISAHTLVDSGCAAASIISDVLLNKINTSRLKAKKAPKSVVETRTRCKLADDRMTEPLKATWIELKLGHKLSLISYALILPNCNHELIIGVPTIRTARLEFDHDNMTATPKAKGVFEHTSINNSDLLVINVADVQQSNSFIQLKSYPPRSIQSLPAKSYESAVFKNMDMYAVISPDDSVIVTSEAPRTICTNKPVTFTKARQVELATVDLPEKQSMVDTIDINPHLPSEHVKHIKSLVNKYEDIFQKNEDDMGCLNHYKAVIETNDARPIRCNPYPLPKRQQADLEQIIERLERNNVLTKNTGYWAFPVFILYTKNKPRMLVDIRKLNALLTLFPCPLPNIRELIRQLTCSKYYTILDMPDGYFQMELEPKSQEKAGIVHANGTHMFKRVPQGLSTAVAQFMYAVNLMYEDIPRTPDGRKCVEAYLDDTLVHGKTFKEMTYYLEAVFSRYRKYGAKLSPRKVKIGYNEITFLGLVVGMNGIKPDPAKLEAVQKLQMPKTLKELRSLIGVINQLASFFPGCATLLEPFTRLTRKSSRDSKGNFKIQREHHIALSKIRALLCDQAGPVLDLFDETRKLVMYVDASNIGAGACLYQLYSEKVKKPLGYFSRKFKNYELHLTTTEKEALAIVMACQFFRTFLLASQNRFIIRTDHCGLCWLFKMKDYDSKCARWSIRLSFFKFDIEHVSGKNNTVADHLSRFVEQEEMHEDGNEYVCVIDQPVTGYEKFQRFQTHLVEEQQSLLSDWQNEVKYKKFVDILKNKQITAHKGFTLIDGTLYKLLHKPNVDRVYYAICISRTNPIIGQIMKELHDKSHIGRDKMIDLINTRFYWPNYWQDVYNYVNSCSSCQRFKANNHPATGVPRSIDTPNNVCEEWELDFCGPFERSANGNTYILTAMDLMSRFLLVHPSKNQTEQTVIRFLRQHIFSIFGYPARIRTDGGPCFKGNELRQWLEVECKVGLKQGASYDSDFHSCVERIQGTFLNNLRATLGDDIKNWDRHVKAVAFMYNCTTHSSTKESPYVLMFGREPRLNTSINLPTPQFTSANKNNEPDVLTTIAKYRFNINQRSHLKAEERKAKKALKSKPKQFEIGDLVFVETIARSRNKLDPKFKGPYEITCKWDGDNYSLVLCSSKNLAKPRRITLHVDKLRKYFPTNEKEKVTTNNLNEPPQSCDKNKKHNSTIAESQKPRATDECHTTTSTSKRVYVKESNGSKVRRSQRVKEREEKKEIESTLPRKRERSRKN